jgi:hypothetical protein
VKVVVYYGEDVLSLPPLPPLSPPPPSSSSRSLSLSLSLFSLEAVVGLNSFGTLPIFF